MIACIVFWSCCRLGELLIDTKPDPKAHILRSMSIRHGIAANGLKFVNLDIPRTKTKVDGDTINLSDSVCHCSPISAFEHHLASNINISPNAPLFSFKTAEKSWLPM